MSDELWIRCDESVRACYQNSAAMQMRAFMATHPWLDSWALVHAFDKAFDVEPFEGDFIDRLDIENAIVTPIDHENES